MKKIQLTCLLVLIIFLLIFPLFFPDTTATAIIFFTFVLMIASIGWNIFSGYTRYLSLGHATFYGVGAYILALLCQVWHLEGGFPLLLLLPLIGFITGLCSLPLGWIALKTRRHTFMVITIALFSLTSSLLPNLLINIIPQSNEIYLPTPPWNGLIFNLPFYYTGLLLLLCAVAISRWIRSSQFGLCLLAIGEDEDRAWSLGNKTSLYKLIAWGISAVFVGMAGALNAYYLGSINATSAFTRTMNIALPITVFIGGVGDVVGPLLGALFTGPLQQYLVMEYGAQQGADLIIYGILFARSNPCLTSRDRIALSKTQFHQDDFPQASRGISIWHYQISMTFLALQHLQFARSLLIK